MEEMRKEIHLSPTFKREQEKNKSAKSERIVRNVEARQECFNIEMKDRERSKSSTMAVAVERLSRIKIENKPLDMMIRQ